MLSLVFIIVIMFSIDTKLALISFTGLPVLLLTVFLIKNKQRKAWQDVSSKQSNLNAYIHEGISGIKVTQAYVREDFNLDILKELGNRYRDSWMTAVNTSSTWSFC